MRSWSRSREIALAPEPAPDQALKMAFLIVESTYVECKLGRKYVESMKKDAYVCPKETTADPYMKQFIEKPRYRKHYFLKTDVQLYK